MNYYDRKSVSATLAVALKAEGWTVYRYKEDKSDSMTDYYDPASWLGGVASHPSGALFVCDHSDGTPEAIPVHEQLRIVEPCMHCNQTGEEPGGWTLADARARPQEYNRHVLVRQYGEDAVASGKVFAGCSSVVSPIPFKDGGVEKCTKCHGSGEIQTGTAQGKLLHTIPAHLANPPRTNWHLERDGRVVRSGWILQAWDVRRYVEGKIADDEAVMAFVRGLLAPDAPVERASVTSPTVRFNEERGGIEVVFPAKPAPAVLERLKAAGFRWSRPQGLWWARRTPEREQAVQGLAS